MEISSEFHEELSTAISKLATTNEISITEQEQLTKLLAEHSQQLIEIAQSSKSREELEHQILRLVRHWRKPIAIEITRFATSDESSPLDSILVSKKRHQHAEAEVKLSLANIAETNDDLSPQHS
jgi:hypothetical protein